MRILVSGATGFLGRPLCEQLRSAGHDIIPLVRQPIDGPHVCWPAPAPGGSATEWNPSEVSGMDAVIHLAGANIGEKRWSKARKAELRESRVKRTTGLVEALLQASQPPKIFLAASATGIYGDRGDEVLTEQSRPGQGFLADLAKDWESASLPLEAVGIRRCCCRFAMILDPSGGALPQMALPFRWGLGARLGSGNQWMSWTSRRDAIRSLQFLLESDSATGAYNLSAPGTCTNRVFTQHLAAALHRPAWFVAPKFALTLMFGELAEALLLSSQRTVPANLTTQGFVFLDADLRATLHRMYSI